MGLRSMSSVVGSYERKADMVAFLDRGRERERGRDTERGKEIDRERGKEIDRERAF